MSRWKLIILFVALAFAAGLPLLHLWRMWGVSDWDQFLFYAESGRVAIVGYGEAPVWSPYFCGGNVLVANPQSQHLSPTFLPVLVFGSLAGMKLKIFIALFLGLLGMFTCARVFGASKTASVFAAAVYQLAGWYFAYSANGQQWIQATAFVPWAMLALRRSEERVAWVAPCGVFIAMVWLEGGIYPFPFLLLLMFGYAMLFPAECGFETRLKRLAAAMVIAFCVGAAKFLPFLALFSTSQRALPLEAHDVVSLKTFIQIFLTANPDAFHAHYNYFEYFGYVGPMVVAAVLLSLLKPGKSWRWWVLIGIGAVLIFGVKSPLPLWPMLHSLPGFGSMHVTSRFRIFLALPLAMVSAAGLDVLLGYLKARSRAISSVAGVVVVAVAVACLLAAGPKLFYRGFSLDAQPVTKASEFRQVWRMPDYGSSWSMYPAVLSRVGTVSCYEYFTIPTIPASGRLIKMGFATAAADPLYKGEVYTESGKGAAKIVSWSPHRVAVDVATTEKSDYLAMNQNYYSDWRVAVDGRPAKLVPVGYRQAGVRIAAGSHRVVFYYRSNGFIAGIILGIATVYGCLVWFVSSVRKASV